MHCFVTNDRNVQIFKFCGHRIQVEMLIAQNAFMKGIHSGHNVLFPSECMIIVFE
jgi:hypothetical protein